MARTNYQHGKRLRELAKKQKREEKAQKRKEKKESGAAGELGFELGENTLLYTGETEAGESSESGEGVSSAESDPQPVS